MSFPATHYNTARRHAPQNTVRRHAPQNEGQSRRKLSVNAPHQIYPKGRYGGTTRCSLSRVTRVSKIKPRGRRSLKGGGQNGGREALARQNRINMHLLWGYRAN